MRQSLRTTLLVLAALFIAFGALVNATVVVPHLRADMAEIHVRPTLLGAVSMALSFGTFAMFGFAVAVLAAALQTLRGRPMPRLVLGAIAATYVAFGIAAFAWSRSPHALGYAFPGSFIAVAIGLEDRRRRGHAGPGGSIRD